MNGAGSYPSELERALREAIHFAREMVSSSDELRGRDMRDERAEYYAIISNWENVLDAQPRNFERSYLASTLLTPAQRFIDCLAQRAEQLQPKGQNAMTIPYTITNENITIILDGKPLVIPHGSPQFHGLRDALFREDWSAIPTYATRAGALQQWLGDKFVVSALDKISYEGVELPESLNRRIMEMVTAGESPAPLFAFYERLHKNPSFRSRTQLFSFLKHTGIPIEPDGTFLAYKGVREDYLDAHSGTIDNTPGANPKMARNLISDDPSQTCHIGLHVGALGYAGNFSQRVIIVRVDPENVVCVPNDYNGQKMRVCEYVVIGNHLPGTEPLPSTTHTVDVETKNDPEWGGATEDLVESDVEEEDDDNEIDGDDEEVFHDPDDSKPDTISGAVDAVDLPKPSQVVLALKTGPKAATFNRMKPAKLMEQSIEDLRKYASAHLKIVGASKLSGGKSALVSKILNARRRRSR